MSVESGSAYSIVWYLARGTRFWSHPVAGMPITKVNLLEEEADFVRRGVDKEGGKFLIQVGLGASCPGVSGPDLPVFLSSGSNWGGWRLGLIATWWPFLTMQPQVPALGQLGWRLWDQARVYLFGLGPQITEHLLSTCMIPVCVCVCVQR